MDKTNRPTQDELRKAQAALNAVNVAYEYFSPAPWTALTDSAKVADYLPYTQAA